MLKEILQYPLMNMGSSVEFIEIKSPYSGEIIASVAQADEKAIDTAIAQAQDTFKNVMSKMPAHQRSAILTRTAKLIEENLEDFARTIALEGGKPIKDARIEAIRASGL